MGATQIRRRRLASWLRRQGPTTVAAAAARFEVSERTIFRDLARMRARGVAIEGDPGRGGGIMLRAKRKSTIRKVNPASCGLTARSADGRSADRPDARPAGSPERMGDPAGLRSGAGARAAPSSAESAPTSTTEDRLAA